MLVCKYRNQIGLKDYLKGDNMDKISRTILTFLLGRAKVRYREYFTSKQISQIDAIIWKLDNIEELQKS